MSQRTLFVFLMIVLGLIPANVMADTLFSDGFENGDFTTGGWTTQNGDASVSNKAEYEGTYGAKLAGTTWIEKAISTSGYSSIHVKYYRKSKSLDAGEYLYVEWYDGIDWNELESTQDTSWGSQKDKTCSSGADDNSSFKIRFRINASATNEYAYVDSVEVTGTSGGPTPGVTIVESGGSTDVSEEGPTSDTYTVVLDSQPSDTVTITVDPDTETEVNDNGAGNSINLTFLTTNWDTEQTVTVKAIDDYSVEGAHNSTITHTAASNDNDYNGISISDVVANVTDNDIAGVTIVESGDSTDVNEEGPTSDTYTVVLDTQPSDTVTITVDPDVETEVNDNGAGNSINLTFLTTNWDTAQTVTVKAIDDGDSEGSHTSTITHISTSNDNDYDGISINNVVANVTDNDFPPGQASDPSPADDANDVSISTNLEWTAGSASLSHDVYLGTNFNDVNDANITTSGIFKGNQDSNSYDPGLLGLDTTYYWRIDEKNNIGTTKGNIWNFSTPNDTDSDNIEDDWEVLYGLDPNDANDADLDLDSDDFNNLSEYLHGSDPNDPNSAPSANVTITVPASVNTIQRAINASIDDDIVVVSEGSYYENINFSGRIITLVGTDPNDPNVVATTIIDANNTSLDVAVFNSGEDANSVIDGITLTGGRYGLYCTSSSAPMVQRCVIRNNSNYGVYAYSASPTVSDCEIRENGSYGLYLYSSAASVTRCRILSNTSWGIRGYYYSGIIQNCVIAKNASYGIRLDTSTSASVLNCTVVSNGTYGIFGACDQVENCIIWGNGNDLNSCTATYSCIEDQDAGTGNIHALPLFVDVDNDDYHLWYSSPCIDTGDPNSVYTNEPNDGGGRIDMGAYGNTAEATTIVDEDLDGLADAWEETYWPGQDPNLHDPNDDPDADGLRNKDEYYVHWDPNSNDSGSFFGLVHNERLDVNLPSVSLALSMAENADTLILDPNTYYEVIDFNDKPVLLRSTDPNDPNVVASTIIDANNTSLDVAVFNSGEDANSVIDGFTLTGGRYGIYCASTSAPMVQRCVIRNNSSFGMYASSASPTISDCEIRQNNEGLQLSSSAATITRCRILNNTYRGIYTLSYSGTIQNCVIAKNNSNGIYFTYPTSLASVLNCTIVSNTNYGIRGDCDQVENCIIWDNGNDLGSCTATYSCIEDQDADTGNIHALPLFVDVDDDDYHLWYSSPCIDAGDPNSAYANEPNGGGGRIDMGAYGNTAEATTIVDEDSDGLADAWEETYWPGQDPNLHDPNDDPDADGLRNKDEYYIGWDPNSDDSGSVFGLVYNERVDVNFPSVSLALSMAENADTLILDPNTYYEQINFNGKSVLLRSTDPNDPNVVASTIIDANNTSLDVAVFNSGEDANSVIDGITLIGGRYGIYCTSSSAPTVQRCVIRNNSSNGVSVFSASPTISDCEIRQNGSYGVSLSTSSASLSRCRVLDNSYYGISASSYSGTIGNCVVANNSNYGLYCQSSTASVINCTIVSNNYYGINGACAQVKNCIIWGNGNDLHSCMATYSCIEDQDSGTGVIHGNPLFVDADNDDYHLWYSSPCIDTGDPNSVYANEPNGGGGRIDMGAYGNTAEATTIVDEDSDGLADAWEETYWPGQDPNLHDPNDDPDADGLRNKDEYYIGWDPNSDDSGYVFGLVYNERVDVNFPSIFLALATAENGDTLTVDPNTFYENVNFNGKPLTLTSTDPNNPNVVAATIIDANGVGNGVTFSNAEDANSIIQGLTIRNAQSAWQYAGINCTYASPLIQNCVLRNSYSGIYLDHSTAEVTNCQGIYNSYYGMFIRYSSSPTISGGIFSNNGTYGAYFTNSSDGAIQNSVMAKNSNAGISTTSDSSATVVNCTIADNTTYGIYATSATEIKDCILWNNNNDLYNCSATFSCIEDADTGRGNIYANPLFQDADANDFHLDANSPCIDTGIPWFDYSNEPSPNGGRINMGAYGNTSEATTSTDADSDNISDAWETMYWPGDDPNQHDPNDNPDGDSLTNLSEYLFGTDPNTSDPNETLWIAYGSLLPSKFDPTQEQTLTIEYWINIDANAVITIADANDPNNIVRTISQAATVGLNQWIWDGQDVNSLIVENGFYDVSVDANDGVDTEYYDCGTGELDYLHAITNVNSNPYRFIATNNEITTITYDLTVDANMVVNIYDPNGLLFRTLTAPQSDPNEVVWDGRNMDAGQSDSRYIINDGTYMIEVRYEGMKEKEEGIVTVYK